MPRIASEKSTPDALVSKLRDLIISGVLLPGAKVHEVDLSERLGVSRTPLRESLRTLETEGFIRSERNRGFWIAPYDPQEVRDLYPILWTLEGLAIREGGVFLKASLETLRDLNTSFAKRARKPQQAAQADYAFHAELTRHGGNQRLLAIIENLKQRIARYESLYMSNHVLIEASCAQHSEIIDRIAAGKIDKAIAGLEENWRFGMEALLRQL